MKSTTNHPGHPTKGGRHVSVRFYMILVAVLVLAVVGVAYQTVISRTRATAASGATKEVRTFSQVAATQMDSAVTQFKTQAQGLVTLASRSIAQLELTPGLGASFKLNFPAYAPFTKARLDVLSPAGEVVYTTTHKALGRTLPGLGWLQAALKADVEAGPYVDPATGKRAEIVAVPLIGGVGVVAEVLFLTAVASSLAASLGAAAHASFFVTGKGTAPLSVWDMTSGATTLPPANKSTGMVPNGAIYAKATAASLGWTVSAEQSPTVIYGAANHTKSLVIWIALGAALALMLVVFLVYWRISHPISILSRGVRAKTSIKDTEPLAVNGPAEIMTLVDDFNELLVAARHEVEAVGRLAVIVESSADAIFTIDLEGSVTSWNAAATQMFGYSEADLIGESFMDLIVTREHAERMEAVYEAVSKGNVVEHFESERRHKDGRIVDVSVTVSPIRDASGEIVAMSSVCRDITERKRAAAERIALEEQLRRSEREQEQERELHLLADRERIARDLHDTVIQDVFATGITLTAASKLIPDDEVRGRVNAAVGELDQVIRQVRTVIFGIESRRPNSLADTIESISADASRVLGFEPEVIVEIVPETEIPDHVGDQVLAVLREALSNIARHASAHHVSVTVVIDTEVHLTVVDDGVGFDPRTAANGLGLANIRARAEHLGGYAFIASEPGNGTRLDWVCPVPIVSFNT